MVTWECVRQFGGENINRSQARAGCPVRISGHYKPGRSHLRPISAATINPSFFTHYGGSKYWDTLNYRQFRAQLSCFTAGSHPDFLSGVKDILLSGIFDFCFVTPSFQTIRNDHFLNC